MAVSKRRRFEVFKRDLFTCQYCGKRPPGVVLECDHVSPVSKGGSDEYENLVTSCFDCNRGKSDVTIDDSDCEAVQMMQLESIAQLAAFNEMIIESHETKKRHHRWLIGELEVSLGITIVGDDERSVVNFARTMGLDQIIRAAEITGAKPIGSYKRFKYFCGVCWNMINADSEDGDCDDIYDDF